jgi:predicted nucleic acid-binding protein
VILDTNALSAFADGRADIKPVLEGASVALPVIVVGEYLYGLAHSVRGSEHTDWLESLLTSARVLEVTMRTAKHYARIRSELRRAELQFQRTIIGSQHWPASTTYRSEAETAASTKFPDFDALSGKNGVTPLLALFAVADPAKVVEGIDPRVVAVAPIDADRVGAYFLYVPHL